MAISMVADVENCTGQGAVQHITAICGLAGRACSFFRGFSTAHFVIGRGSDMMERSGFASGSPSQFGPCLGSF